ncbi:threonine aldolase family protein [Peptostreptococcus faecalis]|uniref:threonine aldolase family protein n=1 Tax=Peptostreptococcus faecalis TaxID=2045015 RepID=UPI000C7A3EB4|nr:beta-eliminating lyase-related protein [Peptostreptococcus faecalis]
MLKFEIDYAEGCLDEILNELVKTNMVQSDGYRLDNYCKSASEKIKEACNCEYLDVHYLVGGTQTNKAVLDTILRPYEGVVSPLLGHINVHEAGAIEAGGHKVLALSNEDEVIDSEGKLSPVVLENYLSAHKEKDDWHMVEPGAVYISQPTERGALYTKDELIQISSICKKFNLPLFVDGARLSYALASDKNDVTLEDLAKYCDIFYIGGTKCGSLFGEAICFTNDKYNKGFDRVCKQKGSILAKGRLLGLQFDVLFTDNLYIEASKKACEYALRIKNAFEKKGIEFIADSYTNQQFPKLSKKQQKILNDDGITFCTECKIDNENDVVRFCTSWATQEEAVKTLENSINKF